MPGPPAHDFRSWLHIIILSLCTVVASEVDSQIRISDAFHNESVLMYYANCFLDRGPCPSDGRAIKNLLPDFIATNCARCSVRNKQFACQLIYTIHQPQYADLWVEFLAKYDPHGLYRVNLDNFMMTCKASGYI